MQIREHGGDDVTVGKRSGRLNAFDHRNRCGRAIPVRDGHRMVQRGER
jgi:hypothetical protein